MGTTPALGPVDFLVLTFPGTTVDDAVTDALAEVVGNGLVTLLDLIVLTMDEAGVVTELEIEDDLTEVGLTGLTAADIDLVSDADVEVVRTSMAPGSTAAILVFEQTWAARLATAVRDSRGEVALHVQVPRDAVETAVAAAATA
ncbi:DUF6325 family protein [Nocardia asteroides]|uniref:DUF1269 domain-containing protein n=1 Tax=Nocardia asteroides NBRC 15531 TaxID=1110697 RepID=U5EK64_NOCAS|nr:DUF6325 family protein [Nocardia asteroides]TLF70271.1 DUF1269 domain-containing protein [Nocardia asteroides NBRC 15531]UGT49799.1 DUF6325 family protein [Nocardia asteroides]SFM01586.1 hypothetical protein SAMN05444423_1011749 [Nocardia asteroides]VEG37452.1 Uncharacterised protein [Nocardia asteroides]BAO98972.1 hypothetical protein [Nocardia asteroides NBRC 15531]